MVEQVACECCGETGKMLHSHGPYDSLCTACLHDLEVRNSLDRAVVRLRALGLRDPEAALNGWSEFYEDSKARVRGDWLRLAVACYRADILLLHHRWDDAARELSPLMDQVEKGTERHRSILKSMALALDGLGRTREAIDMLCKIVLESPDMNPEDILSTLHTCAKLAKAHGIKLPTGVRGSFAAAAAEYGISEIGPVDSNLLEDAIESAHKQRLDAQDRYVKMLEELKAKDPGARREHLVQYAQREPVRFFRDMALRSVGEDDPQGRRA